MKIGIDARMLGPGFGLARYTEQLVKHLEQIDHTNQYVLFMRTENWDNFEPTNPNFTKVLADIPWYSLAEQIKFPPIIKKQKIDLMHFPHWNVPLLYSGRFVITVHDLIMYHFPRATATTLGPLTYWIKDRLHRLVVKNAVKCASKIIVTSEFTKEDLRKTLGVPEEKMTVTYQAPFKKFPISNQFSINFQNQNDQNILNKYNIAKPYILYVGSAYPHKNLETLLQGWKIFEERYDENYQLVLVGKDSSFYQKIINNPTFQHLNIIYTGFVPDDELEILYNNASLYIFPSLYEGFGLPPLEAMAHGVPVASSDSSCLPEILQDTVYYFRPTDIRAISDAIEHLLVDKNLRARLIERGQKLCTRYSWETLAEQTLQIYKTS